MKRNRYTSEEFIQKVNTIHNDFYSYDDMVYINTRHHIVITCPLHGNFEQRANHHLMGYGCPKCKASKLSLTLFEFIDKANKVHNHQYDYSKVIYTNNRTKVEIVCLQHGTFWQTPHHHLDAESGCPKCKYYSKGEVIIKQFLDTHNIKYVEQYTNPDCKDKYVLRFNFYLPEHNTIIEYHGIQHFQFVKRFHKTNEQFLLSQLRDNKKKQWAIDNGFTFLEIPYNQSNDIDVILTNCFRT